MKIRKGFVSNSSSSSFICEVCENIESERDADLGDLGMCECVNGHTMCQSCVPRFDDLKLVDAEVPAEQCPICNFSEITKDDRLACALKLLKLTEAEFEKQIKSQFDSYVTFKEFIK